MSKVKTVYRCEQCGTDHPKWSGQCSECGEWNSLLEVRVEPASSHRAKPKLGGYAGQTSAVTILNQISVSHETRVALVNQPFCCKLQLIWRAVIALHSM